MVIVASDTATVVSVSTVKLTQITPVSPFFWTPFHDYTFGFTHITLPIKSHFSNTQYFQFHFLENDGNRN